MRRTYLVLALLLAAFALKGLLLVPPAPSPAAEFNTQRAAERLARILGDQRPHPVDSPADDAVRGRLVAELQALGLKPEVRQREDCRGMPGSRTVSCSLTRNVVAVIGDDKPGKALLLNAHYDSTPTGPGAADDGIGVATLLEVAANLQAKPLPQPVILLFNEGEEYGLNGAGAFVSGDPLAGRVGQLINIEARGVSGPAWMFETSEPNGAAIASFAAAARRPYANSLTADFAKLIPNYTDVVVFKGAPVGRGWRTLSFAIVGNETRYHSPGDRVEALNRSSLNHLGGEVLAATRTISADRANGRTLYADLGGRMLMTLPYLAGVVLLFLLVVGLGIMAKREKATGRALGACAAAVAGGIAAAFVTSFFAALFRAGDYWRATPLVAYLAVYAAMLAAMVALLGWVGRRVERERLQAASWLLIVLFGALLSLAVPGSIIFFLVAPAIALLGLAIPKARTWFLWIAAIVQLVMCGELLASIEMLLIDGPLWAVAPLAALAALPFLAEASDAKWKQPAAVFAGLALVLWVGALMMPRSTAERPLAFTIDYVRDDVDRKSHWAVASKQAPLPASWNSMGPWDRGILPYSGRTRWLAKAPDLDIPTASVTKLGEVVHGDRRLIRLRLDRGGADAMAIRFDKDAPVLAMGLPGATWQLETGKPEPSILRCTGRSCDGLVVDVELATPKPAEAELIATRFALPPEGAKLESKRPQNSHPQYGPDSSVRITSATL